MENWYADLDKVDGVEILTLPKREILPADPWPEAFWQHVGSRCRLEGSKAQHVKELFQELEPDRPARCHAPAWGLAFFEQETLLFAVTLCYQCSNFYVYTDDGRDLFGFDPDEAHAVALRQELKGGGGLSALGGRLGRMLTGSSE